MAKKKKPKPRKVSKIEKKLKNQLRYQRSKVKKQITLMNEGLELLKGKKKNQRIKFEGRELAQSTVKNILLKRVYNVNNEISKVEKKLERFKYVKRGKKEYAAKRGAYSENLGLVFECEKNFVDFVLKNHDIKIVNGFKKSNQLSYIWDEFKALHLQMDSKHRMYYRETDEKKLEGILTIQGGYNAKTK